MPAWRELSCHINKIATIFAMLACASLSACGGSSSSQQPTQPIINEHSAPLALLQSTHGFIEIPNFFLRIQLHAAYSPLFRCHSGHFSFQRDEFLNVTEMLHEDCNLYFPEASITASFNGRLNFGYSDTGAHTHLSGEDLLVAEHHGDSKANFLFFNGTLYMENGSDYPVSYVANGEYRSRIQSVAGEKNITLHLDAFQRNAQRSGTVITEHLSGRLSLPDNNEQITVFTSDSGLEREQGSPCAANGSLFIHAADGSFVAAHFDSVDHIRLIVNSRSRPALTCEQYLALIRH